MPVLSPSEYRPISGRLDAETVFSISRIWSCFEHMECLKLWVRSPQSFNLWFAIVVCSQDIFKSPVISKVARALLSSSSLPSSYLNFWYYLELWISLCMQSFYDSSTYLIFDASIITGTALKAAGDYTLKMLEQQVSHFSLKNYFCGDQNKKNYWSSTENGSEKNLEMALWSGD